MPHCAFYAATHGEDADTIQSPPKRKTNPQGRSACAVRHRVERAARLISPQKRKKHFQTNYDHSSTASSDDTKLKIWGNSVPTNQPTHPHPPTSLDFQTNFFVQVISYHPHHQSPLKRNRPPLNGIHALNLPIKLRYQFQALTDSSILVNGITIQ